MLSEELENNKIEYKFINGQRVSSEEVLQTAINVFSNENIKLVKALDAEGLKQNLLLMISFNVKSRIKTSVMLVMLQA